MSEFSMDIMELTVSIDMFSGMVSGFSVFDLNEDIILFSGVS